MAAFTFGLNTSTIRPASLLEKIAIAGETGYEAIEMWAPDVEQHLEAGYKLTDVAKALDDQGLARPSMIALWGWCDPDDAKRAKSLDQCQRRLDMAKALGVKRIVAGPPGEDVPYDFAVEQYGRILEMSCERGVPASLEFLGFVAGINTLEKAWSICGAVGNPQGTVTPDIWHMFRGGTRPDALDAVPADHISCFHWNDAPAAPARQEQNDSHRVYPGDGIVDIRLITRQLRKKEYEGCLTLELFNPHYWKEDLRLVARTGLESPRRQAGGP
jgi:sugar phosphate isomerase/epimerase